MIGGMRTPYRIAAGGILHETNTFAPALTGLESFEQMGIDRGKAVLRHAGARSALGGILEGLESAGMEVVPLLYASAMPSGTVGAQAYHSLLSGLLGTLENALPVDGVVLALHGAMVAESQADCEGEILRMVRSLVSCPVVATLDMHGNASPEMVWNADVLVAFNSNPHLDARERGLEAVELLAGILSGGIRPVSALVRPPLLLSALATWTERKPLSAVHAAAARYNQDPRVMNVSVMGGFAYADTPYSGASLIVTTDGDRQLAQGIASELAGIAWEHREAALDRGLPPEQAVREALASSLRPVILADAGDNVGGGTPGDGTVLLQALLAAGSQEAVVTIADAEAAAQAHAAGEGTVLETLVGGKTDGLHGAPVRVRGLVEKLTDGQFEITGRDHFANLYGERVNMGPCAVLRCGGVRILITTRKTPPGDLNQLRSVGIEPAQQNILVVKSAVAFRGAYEPVAGRIIEVDTQGLCSSDLSRFEYRRIPRPVYPLDTGTGFPGSFPAHHPF
jgi:microcystin degradation protein MlrC